MAQHIDHRMYGGQKTTTTPTGQRMIVDERTSKPVRAPAPEPESLGALVQRIAAEKALAAQGLDAATEEELYGFMKTPRSQPSLSLQGLKDAAK